MPQLSDVIKCVGLVSQYNALGVPDGSLSLADDVVIKRENIFETRRGYLNYGTIAAAGKQSMAFDSLHLVHNGTDISYDDGAGTYNTLYGSISAPTGRKMGFELANSNLYVTSSTGVRVIGDVSVPVTTNATTTNTAYTITVVSTSGISVGDFISGTGITDGSQVTLISNLTITMSLPATANGVVAAIFKPGTRKAGAPAPLQMTYTIGAGTVLSDLRQCAYRAITQRTDANSNIIISAPSPRVWVTNTTGSAKNTTLVIYFTPDQMANDVIKLYRTQASVYAAGGIDAAGDEFTLVYSINLTQANIVTGSITVADVAVDSFVAKTAKLYTSPSQEGQSQANNEPPIAKDIAVFKSQFMFYANTQSKQILFFSLLGTGSLTGKTIVLAGTTYNFGAGEVIATGTVAVSATGVAAVDIDATARSLVNVINRYTSNTTVYAEYLSAGSEAPGQIAIRERNFGGAAFTIQGSDSAIGLMFDPQPPVTPATASQSTSSNEVKKNGLFFSKAQQFEAVPALNNVPAGSANKEILRIAALRDSLIIVKEDGVYRLTGDGPTSFSVVLLDNTVICKAADSVRVLNNSVYMLSNQGVVAITDTGVSIVSREIEPDILPLIQFDDIATYTYGLAYNSEREYRLSTMSESDDTAPTQTFVYNSFTKAWTRYSYPFTSAIVEEDTDILYFTKPDTSTFRVYKERKDFTDSDYSDPDVSVTIVSASGTTVNLTSTTIPQVGNIIIQNGTELAISSFLDLGASTYSLVMNGTVPAAWVPGAATMYPIIYANVKWIPWHGGQPGAMKQISGVKVLSDATRTNHTATSMVVTFSSDLDNAVDEVNLDDTSEAWGTGAWGDMSWGGVEDPHAYPLWTPRNKQYCRLLTVGVRQRYARQKMAIAGVSYYAQNISERTSK